MRGMLLTALALVSFMAPARALTLDVADDTIEVTTGFTGANVTVFGTQDKPGDVVVVVEGPARKMIVRHKTNVGGLWTNTDSREFKNVPSFYEMAAAGPVDTLAPVYTLREKRLGIDNIMLGKADDSDKQGFIDALFENQIAKNLFKRDAVPLTYPGPNLFKARFYVPAIVASGQYKVSAYLFSGGKVAEQNSVSFTVVPEGLSADLRRFATRDALLYGLSGMLMAVFAGWLATVLLKRD